MKSYDKVERIKGIIGEQSIDVPESLLVTCAMHTRVYLALTKLLLTNNLTDLSEVEVKETLESIDRSLDAMPAQLEETYQELLGTIRKVVDFDKDFTTYKKLLTSIVVSMEKMILSGFDEFLSSQSLAEQERLNRDIYSNDVALATTNKPGNA